MPLHKNVSYCFKRCNELRDENLELKALLIEHAINFDADSDWDECGWHERVVAALGDEIELLSNSPETQPTATKEV